MQLKGPYTKRNKKERASSVGLCQRQQIATSPTREGEPVGTMGTEAKHDDVSRVGPWIFTSGRPHRLTSGPLSSSSVLRTHVLDQNQAERTSRNYESGSLFVLFFNTTTTPTVPLLPPSLPSLYCFNSTTHAITNLTVNSNVVCTFNTPVSVIVRLRCVYRTWLQHF